MENKACAMPWCHGVCAFCGVLRPLAQSNRTPGGMKKEQCLLKGCIHSSRSHIIRKEKQAFEGCLHRGHSEAK